MQNETAADTASAAQSWDAYWRGIKDLGAHDVGGVNHPALRDWWRRFFSAPTGERGALAMVDLAGGDGAVIAIALEVLGIRLGRITSVDVSGAAAAIIRQRFPQVNALVSDACAVALPGGSFDIVTSQFGVEYAGPEAIGEAVRLLTPGGRLALILHHCEGSIHRDYAASLDAIREVRQSGLVPRAAAMFRTGFAALRGADRRPYEDAGAGLAPAVEAVEDVMRRLGAGIAEGTVARLYDDVARIHGRLPHYDPEEVLGWLTHMESELTSYAGRLSSMLEAAIDPAGFERITTEMNSRVRLERAGPLRVAGEELPLAWVILATGK